jgi:hypothetical protein
MMMCQRRAPIVFRILTGMTFGLALVLVLGIAYQPRVWRMPDPWAYAFAADNFAHGRWTITTQEMAAGRNRTRLQGGMLTQYVEIAPGRWAFEKAPGYPLLAAPFQALGLMRWANIVLAALAAWTLYRGVSCWRDGFTAWVGVTLLLLSPLSLIALHQADMDTYASGALLVIAAGLGMHHARCATRGRFAWWGLLLSGLAAGWAVIVRYTTVLVLIPLGAWIGLSLVHQRAPARELAMWLAGCAIAFGVLFLYNLAVFGQVLDFGYRYSPYQPDFAWYTLNQADVAGNPTWLAQGTLSAALSVVVNQLGRWVQPLLMGWPLLPLALVGLLATLCKRSALIAASVAVVWLIGVYAPYAGIVYFGVTRELASEFNRTWGFYAVDRYLFPALLPLTLLSTVLVTARRVPRALTLAGLAVYVAGGVWLYAQALAAYY